MSKCGSLFHVLVIPGISSQGALSVDTTLSTRKRSLGEGGSDSRGEGRLLSKLEGCQVRGRESWDCSGASPPAQVAPGRHCTIYTQLPT